MFYYTLVDALMLHALRALRGGGWNTVIPGIPSPYFWVTPHSWVIYPKELADQTFRSVTYMTTGLNDNDWSSDWWDPPSGYETDEDTLVPDAGEDDLVPDADADKLVPDADVDKLVLPAKTTWFQMPKIRLGSRWDKLVPAAGEEKLVPAAGEEKLVHDADNNGRISFVEGLEDDDTYTDGLWAAPDTAEDESNYFPDSKDADWVPDADEDKSDLDTDGDHWVSNADDTSADVDLIASVEELDDDDGYSYDEKYSDKDLWAAPDSAEDEPDCFPDSKDRDWAPKADKHNVLNAEADDWVPDADDNADGESTLSVEKIHGEHREFLIQKDTGIVYDFYFHRDYDENIRDFDITNKTWHCNGAAPYPTQGRAFHVYGGHGIVNDFDYYRGDEEANIPNFEIRSYKHAFGADGIVTEFHFDDDEDMFGFDTNNKAANAARYHPARTSQRNITIVHGLH
ncbi:hypothetical protein RUND412_003905 [Rhizina undulata]